MKTFQRAATARKVKSVVKNPYARYDGRRSEKKRAKPAKNAKVNNPINPRNLSASIVADKKGRFVEGSCFPKTRRIKSPPKYPGKKKPTKDEK